MTNLIKYTLQEPSSCSDKKRFCLLLQFIHKLCELKDKGIIIGEFRFGTDDCSKDNSFEPDYYYITRSFEKIEDITINGEENIIIVKYSGEFITQNEHFNGI